MCYEGSRLLRDGLRSRSISAFVALLASFLLVAVPAGSAPVRDHMRTLARVGDRVAYRQGFVLGVGVNVIEANLADPEVRIAVMVARGGIGRAESFASMMRRAQPTAAITGTFFGLKNRQPTGDLRVHGQDLFRGFVGTAVAITEGNLVAFIDTRRREKVDWSLYETVIRGGPRLVKDGAFAVRARRQGFRTLAVRTRRHRTAVGLTRDNRLLLVAVRQGITLYELAKVMRAMGAYHAVALDGGTSTAMYFRGRHIANPRRVLTNALLIYASREAYERAAPEFAPGVLPRAGKPSAGEPPADRPGTPAPDRAPE